MFKPAVKRNAKLRFAISGPAGAGKSFTLLRLASLLVEGSDLKIAAVDTEHGSLSKYAHTDACGGPGVCALPDHFTFDVVEPPTYDPRELVKMIDHAEQNGYGVIITDSLSHYWSGKGGELEIVDNVAARSQSKNSFAAWKTVTPYHNALVDRMLSAKLHVLVSMRTKTEWVIEKDEKGKSVPRKVGLQPVMRDGIEYEFDVAGDIDQENTLVITKSRCSAISGISINKPGRELSEPLKEWLTGAPAAAPAPTPAPAPAPAPTTGMPAAAVPAPAAVVVTPDDPALAEILLKCTSKKGIWDVIETLTERTAEVVGDDNLSAAVELLRKEEGLRGWDDLFSGGRKVGDIKRFMRRWWKAIEGWTPAPPSETTGDPDPDELEITDEPEISATEAEQIEQLRKAKADRTSPAVASGDGAASDPAPAAAASGAGEQPNLIDTAQDQTYSEGGK